MVLTYKNLNKKDAENLKRKTGDYSDTKQHSTIYM